MTARALQALFSLMAVPLALHHYGPERYGLWLALTSFLTVLVFVDQGLGAGIVQNIATTSGARDDGAAREWITAGFVLVGGFGVFVAGVFAVSYAFVPWPRLFAVATALASDEAGPAMGVLIGGFLLSAVLGLVQRVYQGRQAAFINNAWQVLGSALALIGVFALTRARLGVPWLVGAMIGGPAIASAASSIMLFGIQSPELRPSLRHARKERIRSLLRMSKLFLLIQLAMAATLAVDNIIIAQSFGAERVPGYGVPSRLYYFAQTLIALVPQALWPAYAEAIARGDVAWARRAYRRATRYTIVVAGLAAIALLFAAPHLLRVWVGDAITASPALLAGLGAALVMTSLAANVAAFLNATRMLKLQLLLAVALFMVSTLAKIVAVRHWGIAGIPAALAMCTAALLVAPGAWYITKRQSWALCPGHASADGVRPVAP